MRIRFLIALLCTVIIVTASHAAERLHDITTLEDLRRLEPVHLDDNWDARVGLADGGKDAGPWKVLYCLASSRREKQNMPDELLDRAANDQPPCGGGIGPLSWVLVNRGVMDEGGIKRVRVAISRGRIQVVDPPREYLFAQTIALPEKGSFALKVALPPPAGTALWETVLEVTEPEPAAWRELLDPDSASGAATMSQAGAPAFPKFDGGEAILWFMKNGEPVLPFHGDEARKIRRLADTDEEAEGNALPGAVPLAPRWHDLVGGDAPTPKREGKQYPLKLALEKGVLVITSPVKIFDEERGKFLVRWWVNAKPVIAESSESPERRASERLSRQVQRKESIRIALSLPGYLSKLSEGDTVRVQVLYCPDGYDYLLRSRQSYAAELRKVVVNEVKPTFPLETNCVSFEVTPEMLAAREKK